MLYSSGAMPPFPFAVTVPFTLLQDAATELAVTVGAGELSMGTLVLCIQPFASFTYTV